VAIPFTSRLRIVLLSVIFASIKILADSLKHKLKIFYILFTDSHDVSFNCLQKEIHYIIKLRGRSFYSGHLCILMHGRSVHEVNDQ
jgi:hypothetical protein